MKPSNEQVKIFVLQACSEMQKGAPGVLTDVVIRVAELAAQWGAEQSLDGKRLIGFMSPKQLERICDPKDESGVYIPLRKTAAGNFTLALYAAMKGEQHDTTR